jgi:hypothetical protein
MVASSCSALYLTVPLSVTVPFKLCTETLDASSRALRSIASNNGVEDAQFSLHEFLCTIILAA